MHSSSGISESNMYFSYFPLIADLFESFWLLAGANCLFGLYFDSHFPRILSRFFPSYYYPAAALVTC